MSADVIPIQSIEKRRNQTAAELQRVEMLLHQSGLNLLTHHGTAENGTPWVVFSDPETDEVIIHVELVRGEVAAHGKAFISRAKIREVESLAQRLLRSSWRGATTDETDEGHQCTAGQRNASL